MARYNSSLASTTITGTHTISSPNQGAFTNLSGTAPYTVTLPSPVAFPGSNQTFYNATGGTVTLATPSGILTGTGGSNASTVPCFAGNVVSVTSDGTNYVVISEDGSALVATTGTFSGNVTMNGSGATVAITPQTVTINPTSQSTIDRIDIGATNRGSGAFTSLAANAAVAFTANTSSSTTGTGTLVVTGGVGVSGQVTATSVSATNLTGTIQTAAQPNITSTGALTVPGLTSTLTGTASTGTINVSASDPFIRFTDTDGTANNSKWDLRAIGASGSEGFEIRTINDANTVFSTKLTIKAGGQVIIGSNSAFATSSVPLYVVGGASGWSVFERSSKKMYINPNYSDLNTTAQVTTQAADSMHLSLSSRENISDIFIQSGTGNVGINTTDFTAGYTFNVARSARFNGMMLGNGDGSNSADNRILINWSSGTEALIIAQQNVPLKLGVAGSAKVALDSGGHWLPLTNDTQNLGSASQAWANIYTNDLHLNNETKVNGNDVDGTTGNWTIQEGAENLYIINNKTGKKFAFVLKELE